MRLALATTPWVKMKSSYPPLGLGYLAAAAEADGHEVGIFDFGLKPGLSIADAIDDIEAFNPDLLGISLTTNGFAPAAKLATAFKERVGKPVVFGGPHPSLFPKECLDSGADFVIQGEGERSFAALLGALGRPAELNRIPGLFRRDGGAISAGPPALRINDLDNLALPARHLFALPEYPLAGLDGKLMTNMMTSRGCPFNCCYCYKGTFGNRCRVAGADTILREVRQIMSFGIDRIYFIDDLFTFNRGRVMEICRRLQTENLGIKWQCLSRVDLVDEEMLTNMAAAGCETINYGIESGDPAILKTIDKKISMDQVEKAVAATKRAGIHSKGYFMIGLPGDDEESIKRTLDFACRLDLDDAMFSLTTPFPGTKLWDMSGLNWDRDGERFASAFYYANTADDAQIFCNLSEVSDAALLRALKEAGERFTASSRRNRLDRRFGPRLGTVVSMMAGVAPLRRLGKRLLDNGA